MVKTGEGLAGQGGAKIRSLPEQKKTPTNRSRGTKEKTASDQKNTETMQRVTQEPAGEKKRNSV